MTKKACLFRKQGEAGATKARQKQDKAEGKPKNTNDKLSMENKNPLAKRRKQKDSLTAITKTQRIKRKSPKSSCLPQKKERQKSRLCRQ